MNIEYEYIVTNGEIDVDKIMAKRRRKRLLTANARTFESFGLFRQQDHAGKDYTSRVYASESMDESTSYYAVFTHAKLGKTLLVFTPDDRVLDALDVYKRQGMRSMAMPLLATISATSPRQIMPTPI